MGESQKGDIELKSSDTKKYLLYDSILLTSVIRKEVKYGDRNQ